MRFALLDHLSDPDRRAVLAAARRRRFARGETIFHEGDPGDALHLVCSGHVVLRVTTPLGEVAAVRVVGPGEFFGELALIDAEPRSATARAVDLVETLALHKRHFDDLRAGSSQVDELLLRALATEVRRLASVTVEALYLPADTRLWRRLLKLRESFDGSDDDEVTIPVTQEELGQLAGIGRPTTNRFLQEAEAAGAVRLSRGRITVQDHEWLARRAR